MRGRVIEKHGCAAEACDPRLESHACAQRRLLENQREKAASQRRTELFRARFHISGQLEQLAHLRGIPFHAGQKIVGECERCGGSVHVYLVAAMATGCAGVSIFFLGALAITVSNFLRNSVTSFARRINGGSRRRICSWVQFMSRPRRSASSTNGVPSIER